MLEMQIIIAAPQLADAINKLAAAIANGKNPHTVCNQYGADNKHIDHVDTVNLGTDSKVQTQAPVAPVDPPPAATAPVQTAAPIVPTAPYTSPAPTAAPVSNTAPAPAVPTSVPQYTLEMIATAGSALIDAGKLDQLMALLGRHGVDSLTNLKPETYGAVAMELRAMGARI